MRILIVEDEPVSAAVLSHMVQNYGEVSIANDGEEALEKFLDARKKGQSFDLIFLDIMMPNADGQEVLDAIRACEDEAELPSEQRSCVIMVTAVSDPRNLYLAHRSSCQDYLTKPVVKEKLVSALKQLGFEPIKK